RAPQYARRAEGEARPDAADAEARLGAGGARREEESIGLAARDDAGTEPGIPHAAGEARRGFVRRHHHAGRGDRSVRQRRGLERAERRWGRWSAYGGDEPDDPGAEG